MLAAALAAAPARSQDGFPRAAALSTHVADVLRQHEVPGASVAVFRDFQIEWARGFGVAHAETRQPVDALTLFQAASISKPVAALAVLRLVQQGRLDLDRDVNEYLSSWKLPANELTRATPVTLRHILSHSGGLGVSGFPGYASGVPVPTVPQLLDGLPPANTEAVRVTVAPGTKFAYSGGGTTILQLVVTDVLKVPFPEAMRRLVLEPVGMRFSTYEQPLPERLPPSPRPATRRARWSRASGTPTRRWRRPGFGRPPATWRVSPWPCSAHAWAWKAPCSRGTWRT